MTPLKHQLQKVFAANVADAGPIVAPVPTTTMPDGEGVIDVSYPNMSLESIHNGALLIFYGTRTAADNETLTARITGWRHVANLWVPIGLANLLVTLGTQTGVSGADVSETEYFADTIADSGTPWPTAASIAGNHSPADNTAAAVVIDSHNCTRVQVQLARGTCASCNALIASH